MTTTAPAFSEKEPLLWTSREGENMATRRGVEFVSLSAGGDQAIVRWNLENYTVPVSELERQQTGPHPPPPWLEKWHEPAKPPPVPSQEQLEERLATAREALARTHQHVKDVQAKIDAARTVVDRADRKLTESLAALRLHDHHMKARQQALESSLLTGRPLPATSTNGRDPDPRHWLAEQVTMSEQACNRFQSELAAGMGEMNEALAGVRSGSAAVLSLLAQREIEALRRLESQAAVARAELLAVASHWFAGAAEGPIRLPAVSATYIEAMPPWEYQDAVRNLSSESRLRPWKSVFDRLVQGDVAADFMLGE